MSELTPGSRVLFIGPKTFNYDQEIVMALEHLGLVVTYVQDPPGQMGWIKGVNRLFPRLAWVYADRYYARLLAAENLPQVDVVFVIKGEGLSATTLRRLRAKYSSAKFVLYLWDSLANVKHVRSKFPFFDTVFSFDRDDCRTNVRLRYRPLFYLEKYLDCCADIQPGTACFFLGTLNGDRPAVLVRLIKVLRDRATLDYWLFVRSNLELRLRKWFDGALRSLDRARLIYRPMSSDTITHRVAAALAVVDIEHPKQTGLTMRTFEILASGRKLITTNSRILQENFYDPTRILVIDRMSPTIPDEFLHSTFLPLPPEFFRDYSIYGWLHELLIDQVTSPQEFGAI